MDIQKELLGLIVSGNIISELSDRIPSNFMALNELIKNAYDADASLVDISISTSEKKIIIQDDGCGMDKSDMVNLLHIARSNKYYAVRRSNGRITQGEKGLGALATFHFGNSVTWETSKNNVTAYKFTILKNKIIEKDNINEYQTAIEELNASFKGTRIIITDIQDEDFDFIVSTLKNKRTTSKLVRSLFDSNEIKNFIVNISIDGKPCVNKEDITINADNNKERIYKVEYDSCDEKNIIKFLYKDTIVFQEKFSLDNSLDGFRIKCSLNIYDLGGKIFNAHFPALYHKEQEKPDITPLVYINQGFFKNYNLFDVDIIRKARSGDSLPQMTGEIEIWSQSSKLMFNSDRTEINENIITAMLKTEIERLNKTIQNVGSQYKVPFIDMNREKVPYTVIKYKKLNITGKNKEQIDILIKNNISNEIYAKLITYQLFEDKVIYSFLGQDIKVELFKQEQSEDSPKGKKPASSPSQNNNGNAQNTAVITLTEHWIEKTIGTTGQINLYDYIIQKDTIDSSGKVIPLSNISIRDNDGLMQTPNVLPALTSAKEIKITYTYNDVKTGSETKILIINFVEYKKSPIKGTVKDNCLIHNHGIGGFKVSFDNVAGKLVAQINSLKVEDYSEMIACSLRTLFELGIDAIKRKNASSANFNNMKSSISLGNKTLEDKVKEIVDYVKNKKNRELIVKQLISLSCTNVGYDTLKNIANSDRISTNAGESNLGAHKGTTNLSRQQIIDIANSVSSFLIFVEGIIGAANEF